MGGVGGGGWGGGLPVAPDTIGQRGSLLPPGTAKRKDVKLRRKNF